MAKIENEDKRKVEIVKRDRIKGKQASYNKRRDPNVTTQNSHTTHP